MSDALCRIDIKDIDLTDERYRIGFPENDVTALALSIQKTGLICPPIVKPVQNKFIVISGFNRINALILNNEKQIIVLKVSPELSDRQCLMRSITMLVFQRQLTQYELIRSVQLLHFYLTVQEIFQCSSWLFQQALNIDYIEQLLAIGNLPDPLTALIRSNQLSLKTAQKLLFFNMEDVKIILSIFEQISASSNKQLEIVLHLKEISARDKINIKTAYQCMKLDLILNDESLEPSLKLQRLRARLFDQRFPHLSEIRTRVKKNISSLKLGPQICINPPENFENPKYAISFTAKNFDEFKSNVFQLSEQIHHDGIKKIFES